MTETGGPNGVWLRWIVGILCTIILLLVGAWANAVSTTLAETQKDVNMIDKRLTRIETALEIPRSKE